MKILLACWFACMVTLNISAQSTTSINARTFNPRVDSTLEKLVQLALLNARVISVEEFAEQFYYEYKLSKTEWLNNIVIAGNLNELSIKQDQGSPIDPYRQSTQYPRYNIGARIPLGLFINNGKQNKAALHKYQSYKSQIGIEKQKIRAEVMLNYENYIYNKQLLGLQQELIQDAKILMAKHEESFGNGELTLEKYTASVKVYNSENVKELAILHTLRLTEISLEELIGMNLLDALAQIDASSKRN